MRVLPPLFALLAGLAVMLPAGPACSKDYFLTIGGGYWPTGNQVSLEKNVLLFEQLLREQYPDGVSHDIYFSDGSDPARDLQYRDPAFDVPTARLLLARVFQETRYQELQYRSHSIDNVRGAANREDLDKWFADTGAHLRADDQLMIYVTAHGGRSVDEKTPQNTTIYLWNRQRLQMKELASLLDKIPPEVAVVTVMVQCHAGGFANLIFNQGDPQQGVTPSHRCGFFATVHDRGAAGCTPDINEEDYHEYSSYFWAALRGRTRTGDSIASADYNGDHAVSFDEAHAYAILEAPTIDIPIKTSDIFLRKYSRLPGAKGDKSAAKAGAEDLLSVDGSYALLVKHADAADAAVLAGLSAQLQLTGDQRGKAAAALAKKLEGEKKSLDGKLKAKQNEHKSAASKIRGSIQLRWPEMANRWHPRVSDILRDESDQLVRHIQSHPQYAAFKESRERLEDLATQKLDQDRHWAKCQRFLRVLENVALQANLPKVATPEIQQRHRQLLESEAGVLGLGAGLPASAVAVQ